MSDHITLKPSRYLENSTNNIMIPTHRNILFSIYIKRFECLKRLLRTRENFSKSVTVSVAASTLGRSHLVFIYSYFIPPTYPTNVAWDGVHHGLVYDRLAFPSRSTLIWSTWFKSRLFGGHNVMWVEWSRVCLFLACRWFLWFCGLAHYPAEK